MAVYPEIPPNPIEVRRRAIFERIARFRQHPLVAPRDEIVQELDEAYTLVHRCMDKEVLNSTDAWLDEFEQNYCP